MRYFAYSLALIITVIALLAIMPQHANADEQLESLLGKEKVQAVEPAKTMSEYVRRYYRSCLRDEESVFSNKSLWHYCGCTAQNFKTTMTLEQVLAIDENTKNSGHDRSRALMFVYAPCVPDAAKRLIYEQCNNDPKNGYILKQKARTCSCIASGVAQDLREDGEDIIKRTIDYNVDIDDPISTLMPTRNYEISLSHNTRKCRNLYERGF